MTQILFSLRKDHLLNMDFYVANAVVFATLNVAFSYRQLEQNAKASRSKQMVSGGEAESISAAKAVVLHFKKKLLPVYLLISGADWL